MIKTNSENYIERRGVIPAASGHMAKVVSQYRRERLESEVERGSFKEMGNSGYHHPANYEENIRTAAGNVLSSAGIKKYATGVGGGTGVGLSHYRGGGDTLRQIPEIYGPLWLNSNLNLPRDRTTINAWSRAFFALNPVVQNAISLHSTYPISKLNISCKDPEIQKFFEGMIEEIDLMNICTQIAQEYWLLGEAFVYAELDDSTAKWSRLLIQNPDYMVVKHSVVAGEPLLSLRPDENLKRIVTSNNPADIQQRYRLDPSIIEHVRKGENIPLSNFYASHIPRKASPYETRGVGLVTSCFRQLMLFDQLRESKFAQAANMINPLTLVKIGGAGENHKPTPADLEDWREVFECHDEETEVLTADGFKKYNEVMEETYVMNGTTGCFQSMGAVPKSDVKIACFNPDSEELEYHEPSAAHIYDYDGDMYHFKNDKMDIKVTPNHRMWAQKQRFKGTGKERKSYWGEWGLVEAQDLPSHSRRFRSNIKWKGDDSVTEIDVCGYKIPIELYLEFLGYVISEGCVYSDKKQDFVSICQNTTLKNGSVNPHFPKMKDCIERFAKAINSKKKYEYYRPASEEENRQETWSYKISSKDLYNHFKNEVGTISGTKANHKIIPRWVLQLSPRLLQILLDALVAGDGSVHERPVSKNIKGYHYYTTSKQLADNVFEAVYKAGYVPTMFIRDSEDYLYRYGAIDEPRSVGYTIGWSTSSNGHFPLLNKYSTCPRTKKKKNIIEKIPYKGKVWCFTVPTGLFITRRNGKITIQGNSAQYDKDFKIFCHDAVTVERVGWNQGIIDISNDITQLLKEIYIGLMVPQVLMDGGSDVTYANGGVTLDVLRQRYLQFRNYLASWLRRRVFAPISEINEFYEKKDGQKILVVPDIEWNHMSLFDAGDYIQTLMSLNQGEGVGKKISNQTVYRSLGVDYEDEVRKIRTEAIQDAIYEKEMAALTTMGLNELRALSPDDSIEEPEEEEAPALPGEIGEEDDLGGLGELPGLSAPPMGGGGGGGGGAPSGAPISDTEAPEPPMEEA